MNDEEATQVNQALEQMNDVIAQLANCVAGLMADVGRLADEAQRAIHLATEGRSGGLEVRKVPRGQSM